MRYQRNLNGTPYHSTLSFICIDKNFRFRSPLRDQSLILPGDGRHLGGGSKFLPTQGEEEQKVKHNLRRG